LTGVIRKLSNPIFVLFEKVFGYSFKYQWQYLESWGSSPKNRIAICNSEI